MTGRCVPWLSATELARNPCVALYEERRDLAMDRDGWLTGWLAGWLKLLHGPTVLCRGKAGDKLGP